MQMLMGFLGRPGAQKTVWRRSNRGRLSFLKLEEMWGPTPQKRREERKTLRTETFMCVCELV